MSHEELSRALDTVHQELSEIEHFDPEEVEKLRETVEDIQTALEKENRPERSTSLSQRIGESARHFEETHPRLTNSLGRIADILQGWGI
jgi:uncharacterized membrane protein YccC